MGKKGKMTMKHKGFNYIKLFGLFGLTCFIVSCSNHAQTPSLSSIPHKNKKQQVDFTVLKAELEVYKKQQNNKKELLLIKK